MLCATVTQARVAVALSATDRDAGARRQKRELLQRQRETFVSSCSLCPPAHPIHKEEREKEAVQSRSSTWGSPS